MHFSSFFIFPHFSFWGGKGHNCQKKFYGRGNVPFHQSSHLNNPLHTVVHIDIWPPPHPPLYFNCNRIDVGAFTLFCQHSRNCICYIGRRTRNLSTELSSQRFIFNRNRNRNVLPVIFHQYNLYISTDTILLNCRIFALWQNSHKKMKAFNFCEWSIRFCITDGIRYGSE